MIWSSSSCINQRNQILSDTKLKIYENLKQQGDIQLLEYQKYINQL